MSTDTSVTTPETSGADAGAGAEMLAGTGKETTAPQATAPEKNSGATPAKGGDAAAVETSSWGELSDSAKAALEAKKWVTPNDAVEGYLNLEKRLGAGQIPKPDISDPDSLKDHPVWDALGVPKEASGYKIEQPKLAEGIEWDADFEAKAKEVGAMLKLTPFQLQGMADLFAAHMNGQTENLQQTAAATQQQVTAELKQEWGQAYDQKLALARQSYKHFAQQYGFSPDAAETLDRAMGSSKLLKFFAGIGEGLQESGIVTVEGGGFGMTPAQAKQKIEELRQDPGFMTRYSTKSHPGHAAAVAELGDLYKLVSPASA